MRCSLWIVLGIVLAGCQGQSSPAPLAKGTVPLSNEPMPPELAALMEDADHDAALARIDKLIQQRPREFLLYSVRSSINLRRGQNQEAVDDLDKAISLNGKDARLFNNRGYIKLGLQSLAAALSDFDRATELTPDYANPYNNRGLLLIARGQYASAIEQFDQALQLDRNYVDAYNNRGFAALQAGQIDRALADFNAAIKLNPKYVNAYNNRGLLRARVGDLDNSIVDFTEAMIIDPLNPKYYEHRREVYLRQSAFDLAVVDETRHDWLIRLQELNGRIVEDPNSTSLLVERARHYLSVDDQAKVIKDLDRAVQIDPNCVPALVEHGQYRVRQKDFSGALADASRLQRIDASQEAFSISGDAHLGLKNYDQAIACYTEARRIDASVAEAYFQKSQVLQAAGKLDEAAKTMNFAIALNPRLSVEDESGNLGGLTPVPHVDANELNAMLGLGRDGIRQGEFASALDYGLEVLKNAPSPEAFSLCGDAYLGLKNYDKAIECYTKIRRIDSSVVEAYIQKSRILRLAGKTDEAADYLRYARELNPNLNADGQEKQAIVLAGSTQVVSNNTVEAMVELGKDCIRQGDFRWALDYAKEILEIAPSSQEAFSLRGDAYLGLKNYDKAIECYAKARRIDESVAEAYFRKAQIQKASGQHDEAADNLKHAIALDPKVVTRLR